MKEPKSMIEQRLLAALEAATPDVLPRILQQIERGSEVPMNENTQIIANKTPVKAGFDRMKRAKWIGRAAAVAAMLVVGGGLAFHQANRVPQATIGFDVNPSIELQVNRAERVLAVNPLNDDARTIVSDMDLKNVDLDVAVNALIGSMVKNGHISQVHNSILISVDSANKQRGTELRERLAGEVDDLLHGYSLNGAVLSQTVSEDDRLKALSTQYGISLGKAALIDLLVQQDETLDFADVAKLSINDINLLIASKHAAIQGVKATGKASSDAYIGADKAQSIALDHAAVDASAVHELETEIDYHHGQMVYEVEFSAGGFEYEYEIDAATGDILKHERDEGDDNDDDLSSVASGYIGADKARTIALQHAGLSAAVLQSFKSELDEDDGRMVYEIEFAHKGNEYKYRIDALTGKILSFEKDDDDDDDGKPTATATAKPTASPTSKLDILSPSQAKAIALKHAGATSGSVKKFSSELENDDGSKVYEIGFIFQGREYEYEIDARTGKILKFDRDDDDDDDDDNDDNDDDDDDDDNDDDDNDDDDDDDDDD